MFYKIFSRQLEKGNILHKPQDDLSRTNLIKGNSKH